MKNDVKKQQWGYTGMIPFSETAEELRLHAYVRFENYQFIQKKADNLESDNARLKAEVERLRKAGDAMADAIYEADPEKLEAHKKFKLTDEEYNAVQLWRAAKEGKQP